MIPDELLCASAETGYAAKTCLTPSAMPSSLVKSAWPPDSRVLYSMADFPSRTVILSPASHSNALKSCATVVLVSSMPARNVTVDVLFLQYTSIKDGDTRIGTPRITNIVLKNGNTVVPYYYNLYKNIYDTINGTPVGIVAFKDPTYENMYMVQIDFDSTPLKWCVSDSVSGYENQSNLGAYSGYNNTYSYTFSDYSDENYPAFAKARNYHAPNTTVGDTYYSGWILGARNQLVELQARIRNSGENYIYDINGALQVLIDTGTRGVTLLQNLNYIWTSTQSTGISSGQHDNGPVTSCADTAYNHFNNFYKTREFPVVLIRQIDD